MTVILRVSVCIDIIDSGTESIISDNIYAVSGVDYPFKRRPPEKIKGSGL